MNDRYDFNQMSVGRLVHQHPATANIEREFFAAASPHVLSKFYDQQRAAIPAADGSAWGAELEQPLRAAYIAALRPLSAFAQLPLPVEIDLSMNASAKIPVGVTGTVAGWAGEGSAIRVTSAALATRELVAYKIASIAVATDEIAMRTGFARVIAPEMLRAAGAALDAKAFSADAASAGVSPAGLFHADNSTAHAATAGGTVTSARTDVRTLLAAMISAGARVDAGSARWCMSPMMFERLPCAK